MINQGKKPSADSAEAHKQAIVARPGCVLSTSPQLKIMKTLQLLLAPVAMVALVAFAPVEGVVGKSMPAIPIEGLTQTKAKSFDEYTGRAVLVEFFAYW